MQVDTIDYWLRQSSLQRLRHTKHDKSSETYTDNIKKGYERRPHLLFEEPRTGVGVTMSFPRCLCDSGDASANLLCQLNSHIVPIICRYGQFLLCLTMRSIEAVGGWSRNATSWAAQHLLNRTARKLTFSRPSPAEFVPPAMPLPCVYICF